MAFFSAGPMMRPNRLWGPRPDSGMPLDSWRGNFNAAYDTDED